MAFSAPRARTLAVSVAALLGAPGCASTPRVLPDVDTSPVAVADPGSQLPAGWQHGAFIEIFVRGYKDSDGDGIGDLRGVTQSLPYLADLGVTGIWLMPITASQDHDHGYAVTDYRDLEPAYGSLADLDELVAQAHARGIGIIVDYVMNHSAAEHPAFLHASASTGDAYRSWYVWSPGKPTGWSIYGSDPWRRGTGGYYFAGFWDQMPDWNLREPSVVAFHHDNLRFWLNRGIDGFRFDAVANLVENGASAWESQPESRVLMGDVRQLVEVYAQRYLVCEAPPDPAGFAAETACGSAFAFGHQYDLVKAAKGDAGAIQAVADYFTSASPSMATMVSNHDSFAGQRLFDQVDGDVAQYKLAAATYLLQPGIPFIYYGEEIGMAGAAKLSGDPKLRTPMSWTGDAKTAGFTTGQPFRALAGNVATHNAAAQAGDPGSILAFYKAMLGLRRSLPSIARGAYEAPSVAGQVMSFRRVLGSERTLVVINYGEVAATAAVQGLPPGATFAARYPSGSSDVTADAAGSAAVTIGAQSVAVFVQR